MLLGKARPAVINKPEQKRAGSVGSTSLVSSSQATKGQLNSQLFGEASTQTGDQNLRRFEKPLSGSTDLPSQKAPVISRRTDGEFSSSFTLPVNEPTGTQPRVRPTVASMSENTVQQSQSCFNLEALHRLTDLTGTADTPLVVKREELEEHRTVTSLFDCRSESITNFSGIQRSESAAGHTTRESSFANSEYTKKVRTRVIRKIYKILHGERAVEELAAQKLSLDCEDKAFRNFKHSIEKYIECIKVVCIAVRVRKE